MVGTFNEDGSVNAMNLHECTRTNSGNLALCVGPHSKTHENIRIMRSSILTMNAIHIWMSGTLKTGESNTIQKQKNF